MTARRNIICLGLDDLGLGDAAFTGSADCLTPNMDALAAESCRLDRFYTHPVCTATRVAMNFGIYPHTAGLADDVIRPWHDDIAPPLAFTTLAAHLKAAGYYTAILGKWHLGHGIASYFPTNRGHDYFYGCTIGAVDYNDQKWPQTTGERNWFENTTPNADAGYTTTLIGDKAVSLIGAHDFVANPLYLNVQFTAPHAPYQAEAADLAVFPSLTGNRKAYAAMIYAADREIGRIVAALKAAGQWNDTLLLLCTDNGGDEDSGFVGDNGALKGSKRQLYNGGLLGPAALSWPNGLLPTSSTVPVHAIDFHRAALLHAGLANTPSQGGDMVALVKGTKLRRFLHLHTDQQSTAWINGDADAHGGDASQVSRWSPENVKVVINPLRAIAQPIPTTPEVYALSDVNETTDLWSGLSSGEQDAINRVAASFRAARASPLIERDGLNESETYVPNPSWTPS